jgi:hypothetical protein
MSIEALSLAFIAPSEVFSDEVEGFVAPNWLSNDYLARQNHPVTSPFITWV